MIEPCLDDVRRLLSASGAILALREGPHQRSQFACIGVPFASGCPDAMSRAFAPAEADEPDTATWERITLAGVVYESVRWTVRGGRGALASLSALFETVSPAQHQPIVRALRLIGPLLARMVQVWQAGRAQFERARSLAGALEGVDHGVILLDGAGDMVFANGTARALLDRGQGLRPSRRSVTAEHLADAVRLQVAIDHVRLSNNGRAQAADEPAPLVTLRRPGRQRPLLAVVAAAPGPLGDERGVMLYLFEPDRDLRGAVDVACRIYGLSPVECRLAGLLVGGASLLEAATAMRIKEQTARGYLKQVFLKTETHRQADLVRLLLSSTARTSLGGGIELV